MEFDVGTLRGCGGAVGDPPRCSRKAGRRVRSRPRILRLVRRPCLGDDLPCAGSHSRTEPSSPVPSTTVSYHLHTTTSIPFGPVATATRWPGDTRSTRGEGNIGANPTELSSPWLQTSQACSSTRITRAVRRRCGAKTASGFGVVMCLSLTGSRQDQEWFCTERAGSDDDLPHLPEVVRARPRKRGCYAWPIDGTHRQCMASCSIAGR